MDPKRRAHIADYRVDPEIAAQVAEQVADFEEARQVLSEIAAANSKTEADLDVALRDTSTDPTKLAAARERLSAAVKIGQERETIARQQADRKRAALNTACTTALYSEQSVERRREIVTNFSEESVARFEAVFDEFRTTIIGLIAEQQFVGRSLAAELRTVGHGSGNFDASVTPMAVPQDVDQALNIALAELRRFPFARSVRQSIIGEGGLDKIAGYEWTADTFPPEILTTITNGLDSRVAAGWIRRDFNTLSKARS